MNQCWREFRQKESDGFVSKRILPLLIFKQSLLYGNSFVQDFGNIKRILNPWDVVIENRGEK